MTVPSGNDADSDGLVFLRYETRTITMAVFRTAGGEHSLSKSRLELRRNSMIQHSNPCPETERVLAGIDGEQADE
jgi:hypothetical protein